MRVKIKAMVSGKVMVAELNVTVEWRSPDPEVADCAADMIPDSLIRVDLENDDVDCRGVTLR